MKIYSEKNVNKKALKRARIAILGYGSQGRAHALNLKDSVMTSLLASQRRRKLGNAQKDGLKVAEPAVTAKGAKLVAMLVPDVAQKKLYKDVVDGIAKGATLLFAHGFNIHFKQIRARKDLDVVLIAPKGPGGLVRRQFEQGRGVPALIAVAQDATRKAHENARLCAWIGSPVVVYWKQSLPRDRNDCSANKPFLRGQPNWWSKAGKCWSKPATNLKLLTTSACMN